MASLLLTHGYLVTVNPAREVIRDGWIRIEATAQGLVLTLRTHSRTLTADPAVAAALCQAVPGLGLTLVLGGVKKIAGTGSCGIAI